MPLLTSWPMTSSFAGVPSLQANGSSGATGDAFPNGIDGRLEIVRDPTGVRGNVMRSRLYETDAVVSSYQRSEIANTADTFGEFWHSWKMMLGDDWTNLNEPFSLMQLHDTPDGGDPVKAPNFLLTLLTGHLRGIVPDQTLPTEGTVFRRVGSVGAQLLRWYDCCVHVNWTKSGTAGFREFFIDGVPVWREVNVVTSYDDVAAPFLKLGVYNGLSANAGWTQRTAYYSDIRIWSGSATYEQGLNRQIAQPRRLTKL